MSRENVLGLFQAHQGVMLHWLSVLVGHESPSRDKPALDGLAQLLADRLQRTGADVELRAGGDGVLLYRSIYHNILGITPAPTDPPPSPVAFTAEDRFVCLEGPLKDVRGEVIRDETGAVRWLRTGGRVHRRVDA